MLPHDVFVTFDSDNVITALFPLEQFLPGGKVVVFEKTLVASRPGAIPDWTREELYTAANLQ